MFTFKFTVNSRTPSVVCVSIVGPNETTNMRLDLDAVPEKVWMPAKSFAKIMDPKDYPHYLDKTRACLARFKGLPGWRAEIGSARVNLECLERELVKACTANDN